MSTPARTPENLPAHLVAEADQLAAAASEFAEADAALEQAVADTPDAGDDFWAEGRRRP